MVRVCVRVRVRVCMWMLTRFYGEGGNRYTTDDHRQQYHALQMQKRVCLLMPRVKMCARMSVNAYSMRMFKTRLHVWR